MKNGSSLLALVALAGSGRPLAAQELPPLPRSALPIPAANWVADGAASAVLGGSRLDITQSTDRATLNWSSFDIGADGVVNFAQPDRGSVALNRVLQGSPSRIFGALQANGRVYLINQNGIVFGEGAQVDVGGLIASTLDLTPEAVKLGLTLAVTENNAPAFAGRRDASGNTTNGPITVASTARLTADGGQLFLFAPQIVNEGELSAADGQVVLAAGEKIFLTTTAGPTDEGADLIGLFVEVDAGSLVTAGAAGPVTTPVSSVTKLGSIATPRGNTTLAGLAVNQLGRITATTAVRQNGSIRLLARDTTQVVPTGTVPTTAARRGGTLTLGAGSVTEVALELDSAESTVDRKSV